MVRNVRSLFNIVYLLILSKDGDDVHAEFPINSAQVPESEAGPSKKGPGEQAGKFSGI